MNLSMTACIFSNYGLPSVRRVPPVLPFCWFCWLHDPLLGRQLLLFGRRRGLAGRAVISFRGGDRGEVGRGEAGSGIEGRGIVDHGWERERAGEF